MIWAAGCRRASVVVSTCRWHKTAKLRKILFRANVFALYILHHLQSFLLHPSPNAIGIFFSLNSRKNARFMPSSARKRVSLPQNQHFSCWFLIYFMIFYLSLIIPNHSLLLLLHFRNMGIFLMMLLLLVLHSLDSLLSLFLLLLHLFYFLLSLRMLICMFRSLLHLDHLLQLVLF